MLKMRVHNRAEAVALIRESDDPEKFHMCDWFTHAGDYFLTTQVRGVINPKIVCLFVEAKAMADEIEKENEK